MNTIVNHKSEDILQVSGTENTPAAWQVATAQNAGTQNAIAWGSCPGQAIAVRRAAQERRSKQTWPATLASHTQPQKFGRRHDKPVTPP